MSYFSYLNQNANTIDEVFGYNYDYIINNPDIQAAVAHRNALPPNINEIREQYKADYASAFDIDNVDFDEYLSGWNDARESPNLTEYTLLFWVLHGHYSKHFPKIHNAIKNNYVNPSGSPLLKKEELCAIIKNAYKLNDWLKTYPRVTPENSPQGITVYRGARQDNIYADCVKNISRTVTVNSLVSTSLSPNSAYRFYRGNKSAIYKITIPPGMPVPVVDNVLDPMNRQSELEVLLPFSGVFRVDSIDHINIGVDFRINTDGSDVFAEVISLTLVDIKEPPQVAEYYCAEVERFFNRDETTPRRSTRIKASRLRKKLVVNAVYKNTGKRKPKKANSVKRNKSQTKKHQHRHIRSRSRRHHRHHHSSKHRT
jgi:hypothetical protein